jgi:hypothetical protein
VIDPALGEFQIIGLLQPYDGSLVEWVCNATTRVFAAGSCRCVGRVLPVRRTTADGGRIAVELRGPGEAVRAGCSSCGPTRGGGPCPYMDSNFVAQSNGQHVSKVQTSADKPYPTCFFYALSGNVQLTVRVYVGEPAVATALVDQVAPVDTSNPAEEPAGWRGGYEAIDSGAVYAVAMQGTAVVVTTNQKQSIKARTVAKQAIAELKL